MATPQYLLDILIEEIEPLRADAMLSSANAALTPHIQKEARERMLRELQLHARPLIVIPPQRPHDPVAAAAYFGQQAAVKVQDE